MISSHGMHAVMTRQIASQGSRTVLGRDYPFFYNPMWGFFGDRTPGPPGTHYFRRSTPDMFFWNMFDQVLIRPELIPFFSDEIEILSTIETNKLTKANGTPDESVGSDHFPILFRLSNESATKAGT
ncbi:MAG: hypothetical protein IID45_03725 [Planctomycetes bacterium]|nr:hypothetical protein [Planctomycetota bacterium]